MRTLLLQNKWNHTKQWVTSPACNKFIASWWVVICQYVISPFSIWDLDPVVPELGSGVKLAGNTVGILTFCECGEATIIWAVLQSVSFRIVHSDFTTCPWRQRLQVTQILFLEYLPWKNWGQNSHQISKIMAFTKKGDCLVWNYSANHRLYQQDPFEKQFKLMV